MSRAGENAAKVCAFLKQHPKVEGLGYLGFLKEGAQKDIFERHCTGAGSTFSLFIKGGEAESFRFLDALKIAKLAVSLRSEEHTSELQSLMRISYAVFCLKKKKKKKVSQPTMSILTS